MCVLRTDGLWVVARVEEIAGVVTVVLAGVGPYIHRQHMCMHVTARSYK